jgi:two-component system sensor histidine kinase/response regulator
LMQTAFENADPFPLVITDTHMPEMDGFELAERVKQLPWSGGTVILMLTSGDGPGDARRARESGVSNYLLKPVRRDELRNVIARTLTPSDQESENLQSLAQCVEGLPAASASILLAEDNQVNQRLVERILEKRGHRVVVAVNGAEALKAIGRETFDLILMDVQMPEVDGFEATRAIRQAEKTSRTHVPIIALTAHAMKGDVDRCLDAGMDGYLSKPIHAADLLRTVDYYHNNGRRPETSGAPAKSHS